jgi:hypothetical protein
MHTVKGMVQVVGKTYRIVRLAPGHYEAVRLLDDVKVGTFRSFPQLEILSAHIEEDILREIARAAIQGAKTSWIGRLDLP